MAADFKGAGQGQVPMQPGWQRSWLSWFGTEQQQRQHPAYKAHLREQALAGLQSEIEAAKSPVALAIKYMQALEWLHRLPGSNVQPSRYRYLMDECDRRGWDYDEGAEYIVEANHRTTLQQENERIERRVNHG